jgi:hypothetical protein
MEISLPCREPDLCLDASSSGTAGDAGHAQPPSLSSHRHGNHLSMQRALPVSPAKCWFVQGFIVRHCSRYRTCLAADPLYAKDMKSSLTCREPDVFLRPDVSPFKPSSSGSVGNVGNRRVALPQPRSCCLQVPFSVNFGWAKFVRRFEALVWRA